MGEEGIAALLARIDERTENTLHRVRNIEQRFDAYATQRDLTEANRRIGDLEKNQTWFNRAVVGAWIAGAGVVAYVKTKF